jgi:HrpA-like RNA helicase
MHRSIDGDLLCLLARRLLSDYPSLRLILMSATLHTEMYKLYFDGYNKPHPIECLSVGCRRFPLETMYLEVYKYVYMCICTLYIYSPIRASSSAGLKNYIHL